MRSDAAPALDQGISPTWTGTHVFNNKVKLPVNDWGGQVFNVQAYGWLPDGTDHSAAVTAVLNAACANPPAGGGTIYFPAGGVIGSTTIASASYNSGTGVVTITTSSAINIPNGNLVTITGLTGTGSYNQLNGTYTNTGSGGTSISYTSKTGLTLTITGGNVLEPGVYRTDSQISIPSDGAGAGQNVNTPYPHQCNLRFTGAGGGLDWRGFTGNTSGLAPDASIVDLRFQSATTGLDSPGITPVVSAIPFSTNKYLSSPLIVGGFTASISGTTLTCTANCTILAIGQTIIGRNTAISDGTTITGGSGTSWTVSHSQTSASQNFWALTAGSGYAVGDYVVLAPTGGVQTSAATIKVTYVNSNGGILHYEYGTNSSSAIAAGVFTSNPTGFTQSSTTGAGSGVVINAPTYFGRQPKIAATGAGALVIDHLQLMDLGSSNTTPFLANSLAVATIENNTFVGTSNTHQTAIIFGGDTDSYNDPVNRDFQGYGSQIRFNHFANVGRAAWFKSTANSPMFTYNSMYVTGDWAMECNADLTPIARAVGDQNIWAAIENNTWEALSSSYFARIVGCGVGRYSNNSSYDGGTYTYFLQDNASFNFFTGPYVGGVGNYLISGDVADVETATVTTNYSTNHPGTSGYGGGPELYGAWTLKGSYNPALIGTNLPGGLQVLLGNDPSYVSLGQTSGFPTGMSVTAQLDAYSLKSGIAGPQGLQLNPSGGNILLSGPTSLGVYTNDSSTGTTLNKLAKLGSTGAIITATTDTNGAIGVVFGNAGTGTTYGALIATAGQVGCVFDSAPSAIGNYVQISSSVAGDCHDAGSGPVVSGQIVGLVVSTVAVSGTYKILLATGNIPVQKTGVWVPQDASSDALTFTDGTAACDTSTHICGSYTVSGNLVTIYTQFVYPVTAGAQATTWKGLPVTAANANYEQGAICNAYTSVGTYTLLHTYILKNTKQTNNWVTATGGTPVNSNLSGATVRMSCTYPAS